MNEYLYEIMSDLLDDEFKAIWYKHTKTKRSSEKEEEYEDEVLCL